jgi:adenine-specific DNA-methyltransferase
MSLAYSEQKTRSAKAPAKARTPKAPDLEAVRHELARARFVARAWAETAAESRRTSQAALLARAALEAFAAKSAPSLKLSAPLNDVRGKLDATAQQLARAMGECAAQLPLLEGCHALTSLYTTLLPGKERSELGAFYTPLPSPCASSTLPRRVALTGKPPASSTPRAAAARGNVRNTYVT